MSEEMVFCISRRSLSRSGLLQGACMPMDDLHALLRHEQAFLPRSKAEVDESWKQLIPYQLFGCGGRFLIFQRGGKVNEKRLVGRCSLGIGGHINVQDAGGRGRLEPDSLLSAAYRERNEELEISGPVGSRTLGIINDDSDAVGRVHLGLVMLCSVEDQGQIRLRQGQEDLLFKGWWSKEEIYSQKEIFEPWSILALELIEVCKAS